MNGDATGGFKTKLSRVERLLHMCGCTPEYGIGCCREKVEKVEADVEWRAVGRSETALGGHRPASKELSLSSTVASLLTIAVMATVANPYYIHRRHEDICVPCDCK